MNIEVDILVCRNENYMQHLDWPNSMSKLRQGGIVPLAVQNMPKTFKLHEIPDDKVVKSNMHKIDAI